MTNEKLNLVRELRGSVCRCGGVKNKGETFCKACYFALPRPMHQRLYDYVGDGYEEAYVAATQELDSSGRPAG
jgi:hypothetical protein